jgi:hypothetical protein
MSYESAPLVAGNILSTVAAQADVTPKVTSRSRDERLDFFRGITMFIIFIAHMPGNSWNGFIPGPLRLLIRRRTIRLLLGRR